MATRDMADEFKGRLEFDERANLIEITLDDHLNHERLSQILGDKTRPPISLTVGPIAPTPPPPPPPPMAPCRFDVKITVSGRARRRSPVREPVIPGEEMPL